MSPSQTPQSSNAVEPPHSPAQSASSQPGTEAASGPELEISAPPSPEIITSLRTIVPPAADSSKVREARVPSPAAIEAPDKSNAITTPDSAPKLVVPKPELAPVSVTPLIVN